MAVINTRLLISKPHSTPSKTNYTRLLSFIYLWYSDCSDSEDIICRTSIGAFVRYIKAVNAHFGQHIFLFANEDQSLQFTGLNQSRKNYKKDDYNTLPRQRRSECSQARLLHWPRTVNTKLRDDGKIPLCKLSQATIKQQDGRAVLKRVALPLSRKCFKSEGSYTSFWCEVQGGGASITGIPLKPWAVLQPWQRAPNLNTCYSDMVRHKPTPTHKSWRPGSQVARACGSKPCSCETDAGCHARCGCPFKIINEVLSQRSIPIACPEPSLYLWPFTVFYVFHWNQTLP